MNKCKCCGSQTECDCHTRWEIEDHDSVAYCATHGKETYREHMTDEWLAYVAEQKAQTAARKAEELKRQNSAKARLARLLDEARQLIGELE